MSPGQEGKEGRSDHRGLVAQPPPSNRRPGKGVEHQTGDENFISVLKVSLWLSRKDGGRQEQPVGARAGSCGHGDGETLTVGRGWSGGWGEALPTSPPLRTLEFSPPWRKSSLNLHGQSTKKGRRTLLIHGPRPPNFPPGET